MLIENWNEVTKLDEEMSRLLDHMSGLAPESPEYVVTTDQLTKLSKLKDTVATSKLKAFEAKAKEREFEKAHDLKAEELLFKKAEAEDAFALKKRELDQKLEESEKPDRVSKETLAVICGNLAGIGMILGYEKANIIASKALAFVMKTR